MPLRKYLIQKNHSTLLINYNSVILLLIITLTQTLLPLSKLPSFSSYAGRKVVTPLLSTLFRLGLGAELFFSPNEVKPASYRLQ